MKLAMIFATCTLAAGTSAARADLTIINQSLSGTVETTIYESFGPNSWTDSGGYTYPGTSSYTTTTPLTGSVSGNMNITPTSIFVQDGGSLPSWQSNYNVIGNYENNFLIKFHLSTPTTVTAIYGYTGYSYAGFGVYDGDYVSGEQALITSWPGSVYPLDPVVLPAGDYTLRGGAFYNVKYEQQFGGAFTENITLNFEFGELEPAAIPEPASLGLLAVGAATLLMRRKK